MENITSNHQHPLMLIPSAILAGVLLWLYSFWVPLADGFYYEWLQGDLFREVRPRALLVTIANILHIDDRGFMFIKMTSLWVWLTLIIWQLAKGTFSDFSLKRIYCLFCISFIFGFSTVTLMSFGPVMIIDVVPYLLVLVVYINLASNRPTSIWEYWINATLLVAAVAIHEKSVFDIGILFLWLFYKKGLKKSVLALGPAILLCGLFLLMLRSKSLTGESLDTYVSIFQRGADFLGDSFSAVEVLIGLGGLGILYLYLSTIFIKRCSSAGDGVKRLALSVSMFIGCVAPLTVAWDTNRLVGLIWLPTIILLVEVGSDLFSRSSIPQILFLGFLCVYQLLLPPILRFPPNVIIAYNSYAKEIYGDRAIQIDAPVRLGETLLFKDQTKGSQFLRSGWSGPEAWGVWSNQNGAVIQLENLDPRITQATIRFNALVSKSMPSQPIAIYANDQFVGKVVATNHSDNVATIMLPQRSSRTLTIRFEMDELATPAQVGISPDDNRKLGVGLNAIEFK
jgi:hypothetical protein